jgi:alpha-L-rhamnosidase
LWRFEGSSSLAGGPAPLTLVLVTCTICFTDPVYRRCRAPHPQVALTPSAPAGTKNQTQQSYRIVARDAADSSGNTLWDSGTVRASETLGIEWGGKPLAARQQVFVNVIITDGAGATCLTAPTPAAFEVGLLSPSDWAAEWIGRDQNSPVVGSCAQFNDDPAPRFRAEFKTTAGKKVASARLYVPLLGWHRFHQPSSGAHVEPSWL